MDHVHVLASHPRDWSKTGSEDEYYAHFGIDHFAGLRRAARAFARALGRRRVPPGAATPASAAETVL